jgi:hypothetical protein
MPRSPLARLVEQGAAITDFLIPFVILPSVLTLIQRPLQPVSDVGIGVRDGVTSQFGPGVELAGDWQTVR